MYNNNDTLIQALHGNLSQSIVQLDSNIAKLQFLTDGNSQDTGWYLEWTGKQMLSILLLLKKL